MQSLISKNSSPSVSLNFFTTLYSCSYSHSEDLEKNIELAKKRRNQVLGRMLKMRYIDRKTYEEAKAAPIELSTMPRMYATNKAPYFCDYVMKELEKLGLMTNLYEQSLHIHCSY